MKLFRSNSILESNAHRKLRERANGLDLTQFSLLTVKQYQEMLRFLELSAGDRVLDVGCGVGRIAYDVHARTKASVVAIDKNVHTLAPGRERFGDQVEYREMNYEQLDFPADSFDAIYCIDSLPFTDQLESVVSRLVQLLRCSGRLVAFWSQRVQPGQDRQQLEANHTKLARLLAKLGLSFRSICFTREAIEYWENTRAALDELEDDFRAEGEGNLVIGLRHEADFHFPFIRDMRFSRHLYMAEKA